MLHFNDSYTFNNVLLFKGEIKTFCFIKYYNGPFPFIHDN